MTWWRQTNLFVPIFFLSSFNKKNPTTSTLFRMLAEVIVKGLTWYLSKLLDFHLKHSFWNKWGALHFREISEYPIKYSQLFCIEKMPERNVPCFVQRKKAKYSRDHLTIILWNGGFLQPTMACCWYGFYSGLGCKKPGCADISRLGVKKLVGTKGNEKICGIFAEKSPSAKKVCDDCDV